MLKLSSIFTVCLAASAVSGFASTPDLPSCDVWLAACHYTNASRESSNNIDMVVIHKTQGGTAAGAASWFANCSSGGSGALHLR